MKMLVLTEEGEKVRAEMTKRLAEPPPWLAELPEADQRKLKEILEARDRGTGDVTGAGHLALRRP